MPRGENARLFRRQASVSAHPPARPFLYPQVVVLCAGFVLLLSLLTRERHTWRGSREERSSSPSPASEVRVSTIAGVKQKSGHDDDDGRETRPTGGTDGGWQEEMVPTSMPSDPHHHHHHRSRHLQPSPTLVPRRVCETVLAAAGNGGRVTMDALRMANRENAYVTGKLTDLAANKLPHKGSQGAPGLGLRVTGALMGGVLPKLDETIEALVREREADGLVPTTVVQVGANEGATDNDPIFHIAKRGDANFRGILVEPVPELYEKLVANYEGVRGDWSFEQALVGNSKDVGGNGGYTTVPFYYLTPSVLEAWCKEHNQTVPWWGSQLGSANKETIMSLARNAEAWRPGFHEFVQQSLARADLPVVSLASIMRGHGVLGHVDLLLVDAQGFDLEVLRSFPFDEPNVRPPAVVSIEHAMLSPKDKDAAVELLRRAGYTVSEDYVLAVGEDLLAWHTDSCDTPVEVDHVRAGGEGQTQTRR